MPGSNYNETIVNEVEIKKDDQPRLISLDYLFHRLINYEVKSLWYSFLSQIDFSVFNDIIKERKYDYENFCEIMHKPQCMLDEYEFIVCKFCKTKHSRMRCPKLHFIAIRQNTISHELVKYRREGIE